MKIANKIKAKKLLKQLGRAPASKKMPKIVLKKTGIAPKDVRDLIEKINRRNEERVSYILDKIRAIKVEPKLERIEVVKPEVREVREIVKEVDKKELKEMQEELETLRQFVFTRAQYGGGSPNQQIKVGGTLMSNRYADFNLVAGTGVSITAADDTIEKNVDITFNASGLSIMTPTGTVDGSNQVFTFTSAPSIVVVDQGRAMQKVSSDGSVNWTGTDVITLTVAPLFDIYAL